MKVLRLVATRRRDFDPAFLAYQRVVGEGGAGPLSLILDLPKGMHESAALRRAGAVEECLAEIPLPHGDNLADTTKLQLCSEAHTLLSDYTLTEKVDLIHAFSWNLLHVMRKVSETCNVLCLISFRGLDVMKGIAYRQVMLGSMLGAKVYVHCPSRELGAKLQILGIAEDPLFIPNGATPPTRQPAMHDHDPSLPAADIGGSIVLIPGHVGEERGLLATLKRLASVLNKDDIVLLAGSRGFLLQDSVVEAYVEQLGRPYRLACLGPLPHSDILRCYRSATLAICPSGREGGQTSILECIAEGVPVLIEDSVSNRELFGDGAPYVYGRGGATLEDLVIKSLQSREFRSEVVEAQVRRSRLHTAEREARKFQKAYEHLLQGRSRH